MTVHLPDDEPSWATDPSADVSTPSTQKQMQGWLEREKPRSDWVNWLHLKAGQFISYLHGVLGKQLQTNWIPRNGNSSVTDLAVTQSGTPAMSVQVAAGQGWVNGAMRYYAAETKAIAAAHATLARKDTIVVDDTGAIVVLTGTPHASPSAPSVTYPSQMKIAEVAVAAAVTTIVNANITDERDEQLGPVGQREVQWHALNFDRMHVATQGLLIGTPTQSVNVISVPLTLTYPDFATPYDGTYGATATAFMAELYHDQFDDALKSVDSADYPTASNQVFYAKHYDLVDYLNGTGPISQDQYESKVVMWLDGSHVGSTNHYVAPNGRLLFHLTGSTGTLKIERHADPDGLSTGPTNSKHYLIIRPLSRMGAVIGLSSAIVEIEFA